MGRLSKTKAAAAATTAAEGHQSIRQNAVNDAELRANAQTIITTIHESRPKNTISVYVPKQKEFEQFCNLKQYCDGTTVTFLLCVLRPEGSPYRAITLSYVPSVHRSISPKAPRFFPSVSSLVRCDMTGLLEG